MKELDPYQPLELQHIMASQTTVCGQASR